MDLIIDFDGTCVTHDFPKIGKDIGAVPILKKLVDNGHNLILFTMRSDKEGISPVTNKLENGGLQDAINWFKQNDIPLYGIQTNPTQKSWTNSPKAYGQLIIDDTALGCPLIFAPEFHSRPFVDWIKVEYSLIEKGLINAE